MRSIQESDTVKQISRSYLKNTVKILLVQDLFDFITGQ